MRCGDMSALFNGPTGRLIKGGGAAPHPKSVEVHVLAVAQPT